MSLVEARLESMRGGRSGVKLHSGSGNGVHWGGRGGGVGDDGNNELSHPRVRDIQWGQPLPIHSRPSGLSGCHRGSVG